MQKVATSLLFACAVIGSCLLFAGYQQLNQVARLDSDWEEVTLQNWGDCQTRNSTLFHIIDYRVADQYYYAADKQTNDFSIVY